MLYKCLNVRLSLSTEILALTFSIFLRFSCNCCLSRISFPLSHDLIWSLSRCIYNSIHIVSLVNDRPMQQTTGKCAGTGSIDRVLQLTCSFLISFFKSASNFSLWLGFDDKLNLLQISSNVSHPSWTFLWHLSISASNKIITWVTTLIKITKKESMTSKQMTGNCKYDAKFCRQQEVYTTTKGFSAVSLYDSVSERLNNKW